MPEASIDEDDEPGTDEHDVGSSAHARQDLPIDSEAKSACVKDSSQSDLGGGVALAGHLHPVQGFR